MGINGLRVILASVGQAPVIAPQEGAGASALLDKMIAAKGGLERLRAIRSIVAETRTEAAPPQGGGAERVSPVEAITYLEYPNRVRVETKLPGATVLQVYDGTRAWVRDPNGTHDVPDHLLRDLEAGFRRDTVAALLAARDGRVRARLLPDIKDAAGQVRHALELSGADLEPIVLYVDPATNLVTKQAYVAGGPGQPLIEELFADYKLVDGVQIAHTASVRRGGETLLERRVTGIKINVPVDPALFKRPAS